MTDKTVSVSQTYPVQIEDSLQLAHRHIFRFTEKQARMIFEKYHEMFKGQSFERLQERGGFGLLEAFYFLTGEHVQVTERELRK